MRIDDDCGGESRRNDIKGRFEDPKKSAMDTQVGGSHYQLPIQPVEFIHRNQIGFIAGNIIKYVVRYKMKNGVEDLKKARHYIDLLIEMETK